MVSNNKNKAKTLHLWLQAKTRNKASNSIYQLKAKKDGRHCVRNLKLWPQDEPKSLRVKISGPAGQVVRLFPWRVASGQEVSILAITTDITVSAGRVAEVEAQVATLAVRVARTVGPKGALGRTHAAKVHIGGAGPGQPGHLLVQGDLPVGSRPGALVGVKEVVGMLRLWSLGV